MDDLSGTSSNYPLKQIYYSEVQPCCVYGASMHIAYPNKYLIQTQCLETSASVPSVQNATGYNLDNIMQAFSRGSPM